MKNLNICIDIDGTITDPYFWLNFANEYFKKKITIDEVTEYEIDKVMGITREEYEEFYNKTKYKMHNNEVKLRENVSDIIKELKRTNNIYFVTAREEDLKILTYSYLKEYDIPYDDVFVLGTHYKVETAKNLNCDIFIEDSYKNAIQLSENGFKVLLLDTNYNRKSLNTNITRVFNWNEIHEIIKGISLYKKAI